MSTQAEPPSEEELRAAYEAEIKRIRVEDVLLDNIVTLVNLGMRRTGLMPGTETERDPAQVQVAIESVRALMPLLESLSAEQAGQVRQALSQLQLAYVQIGGPASAAGAPEPSAAASGSAPAPPAQDPAQAPGTDEPPPEPASPRPPASNPDQPGPAQRSGRLWIPGQ